MPLKPLLCSRRYGYREQVEATLLGVDPVLATVVFGITRTGAVPNNTGVNNRNLWHNTLAITEHINRLVFTTIFVHVTPVVAHWRCCAGRARQRTTTTSW